MTIRDRMSPNQGPRPAGTRPDLIIIHGTAGRSDSADLDWLSRRESQVSYHYLVGRTGTIYRLVPEDRRAWHAGASIWDGRANCNDYSIGIGLSNDGREPYPAAQIDAAGKLVADLCRRYAIPLSRVVGHCHVAPGRKADPWLHFEWGRLFAAVCCGADP